MKHLHFKKLALIPVLAVLVSAPNFTEVNSIHRTIASIEGAETSLPKLEAFRNKLEAGTIKKENELDLDKFLIKRDDLKTRLESERSSFNKDEKDKKVVEQQRKSVETLALEVLTAEASLKDLIDKDIICSPDKEESLKIENESKLIIEGLLTDLEANEKLVVESNIEIPKTEVEEVSKELVQINEESTKDEVTVKDPDCELEEKNMVLTAQIEALLKAQEQLIEAMIGMSKAMLALNQQNMKSNDQLNTFGYNSSPYQYIQPQVAGNWVYYPSGFNPYQPNIFAQPQHHGLYPNQMHEIAPTPANQVQPQNMVQNPSNNSSMNWNLKSLNNLNQPQVQEMQIPTQIVNAGTFGNNVMGFNFNNSPMNAF